MSKPSTEKPAGIAMLAYHGELPKILRLLADHLERGEIHANRYSMDLTDDHADVHLGIDLQPQRRSPR